MTRSRTPASTAITAAFSSDNLHADIHTQTNPPTGTADPDGEVTQTIIGVLTTEAAGALDAAAVPALEIVTGGLITGPDADHEVAFCPPLTHGQRE